MKKYTSVLFVFFAIYTILTLPTMLHETTHYIQLSDKSYIEEINNVCLYGVGEVYTLNYPEGVIADGWIDIKVNESNIDKYALEHPIMEIQSEFVQNSSFIAIILIYLGVLYYEYK